MHHMQKYTPEDIQAVQQFYIQGAKDGKTVEHCHQTFRVASHGHTRTQNKYLDTKYVRGVRYSKALKTTMAPQDHLVVRYSDYLRDKAEAAAHNITLILG